MRLSQIHIVGPLLLVIAVMCLLAACENSQKEIDEQFTNRPLREVAKDIDSYLSQDGKIKARLRAPTMIRSMVVDTQLVLFPDKLHCDFYNDSTELETWVDSKHGKYYENLNKVYLWDSVVVINVKGDTLKAADLWWDQNTKLFYTDKYAEYRTKDRQLYPGKGLEATQDFTRVYFKYPTGRLKVKEDGFAE